MLAELVPEYCAHHCVDRDLVPSREKHCMLGIGCSTVCPVMGFAMGVGSR